MSNRLIPLLPGSLATPGMIAAAGAAGEAEQLAFSSIRLAAIWSRLDELSVEQLDHLAFHLHIDGYEYAGTIAQKRWLIRNYHDWHRYKGTIHGLALYWRVLLNREIYGHAPRHNSYCGRSLSPAERAAFEALHPEARIYPYRNRGEAVGAYAGSSFAGVEFPVASTAAERIGRQLYYFDPQTGTEVKMNRIDRLGDEVIIAIPGRAAGMFCGDCAGGFSVDHGAATRIYQLTPTTPDAGTAGSMSLSARPLLPMHSNYSLIAERADAVGVYGGNRFTDVYPDKYPNCAGGYYPASQTSRKIFPVASRAGDRIYMRFKLYDPARTLSGSRGERTFAGCFRVGKIAAHHGEIAVDATGKGGRWAAFCGRCVAGVQVPVRSDVAVRVRTILAVGRLAMRATDKIGLTLTNHRPITAGQVKAGAITAGQYEARAIF